nr:thiosulfate sulfurtransferase-like [Lytechinus pictus]
MRNVFVIQSLRRSLWNATSIGRSVVNIVPGSQFHTSVPSYSSIPGLVNTGWLAKSLEKQETPDGRPLRVLDATRIAMQTDKLHIPGSVHVDLAQLCDKESPFHYTIPSPEYFADFVGKTLGVDNDTHVVLYDGRVRIMTSPRIWWMFRLFDHEAVSVLDNGLQQWMEEKREVTEDPTPAPSPVTYKVPKLREDLLKTFEEVLQNVKKPQFQIMDSRPVDWYDGTLPSAYPGMKLGIMKMAANIPYPNFYVDGTSKFKSADDLKELFRSKGIDLSRPLTSQCAVGITACTLILGAYVAGKEDVALYDGSFEEYSQKGPLESMTLYEEKPKSNPYG